MDLAPDRLPAGPALADGRADPDLRRPLLRHHIEQRLRDVKAMEGESLSIIHEAMAMFRVIIAFGRETYEHRRFRDQGARAVDARVT